MEWVKFSAHLFRLTGETGDSVKTVPCPERIVMTDKFLFVVVIDKEDRKVVAYNR